MNKYIRFQTYTWVIVIMLICIILPTNTMKRSREGIEGQVSTVFNITQLPTDILQKIFASMERKLEFLSVCKQWYQIGAFKSNWKLFVYAPNIVRTLYLSENARIRVYRYLLCNKTQDDATTLDRMLANDPDYTKHMAELTMLVHAPLGNLIGKSGEATLEVLKKYKVDIDAIYPDHETIRQIDKGFWPSGNSLSVGQKMISSLCDILLCDARGSLDLFLKDPQNQVILTKHNKGSDLDFIINSDVIPRYCSIDTAKKIISLLMELKSGFKRTRNIIATRDEDLYTLADMLLFKTLFGKIKRLDIAETLLQNREYFHQGMVAEHFVEAIKNQDIEVLTLLSKYGLKYQSISSLVIYFSKHDGSMRYDLDYKDFITFIQIYDGIYVSPLMYSVCQQKSATFVKKLIELGAYPFEVNNTSPWLGDVLHVATRLGNQEIIQVLQEARSYASGT